VRSCDVPDFAFFTLLAYSIYLSVLTCLRCGTLGSTRVDRLGCPTYEDVKFVVSALFFFFPFFSFSCGLLWSVECGADGG